jgi:hypothetical protein
MGRKFGFSFSAKRAVGISAAKGRIARASGIPTTRSGLRNKVGRSAGCAIPLAFASLALIGLAAAAVTASA